MSWYKSHGLWGFVGGVAAACATAALTSSKSVREVAVKGVSKCMLAGDSISSAVQSFKDDAEDLAADSRQEAKEKAARKAHVAEIEARVRKQVEEELAAEEAAALESEGADGGEAAEGTAAE